MDAKRMPENKLPMFATLFDEGHGTQNIKIKSKNYTNALLNLNSTLTDQ